jgi:predicted anti-sigma-YlaC factor YlaD
MKSCHDYEIMILDNTINDAVKDHMKSCQSCRDFYELAAKNSVEIALPDDFIHNQVDLAMKKAAVHKKRTDFLSTLAFILLALTLVTTVITYLISDQFVFYYLGAVSILMPLTLPILSIIRKKAVIK